VGAVYNLGKGRVEILEETITSIPKFIDMKKAEKEAKIMTPADKKRK
jgi:hypothetical protein